MASFFTTLATIAVAATTVLAAPAPAVEENNLVSRATGSVTWFNPGLGACGQNNNDNDFIVAVSAGLYDQQHPCGRNIRVKYQGRSAVVKVVDRCGGCAYNDLDLSPAAFRAVIGNLDIGRVNAEWEWA